MHKKSIRLHGVLSLLLLLAGPLAVAAASGTPTPLIPVEDFFRKPDYTGLQLSPNGKYIAALRQLEGHKKLIVIDLVTKSSQVVAGSAKYDVVGARWINDQRLLFSLTQEEAGRGEQTGGGLFAVNRDGSQSVELSPTAEKAVETQRWRGARFFGQVPEIDSDDILIALSERDQKVLDVYRMNTKTRKKTLLTYDTPPKVVEWVFDRAGTPRAALSANEGIYKLYYRDTAQQPWRVLATTDMHSRESIRPLAFDFDDKTLYVAAQLPNADKKAIYRYDFAANKVESRPFLSAPDVDLEGGLLFNRKLRKLMGYQVDAAKPRTVWFDPAMRKMQAEIDEALPGKVNDFVLNPDFDPATGAFLVNSYSDRDPGTYYFFDAKKKNLEEILQPRPWIDPAKMAEYRPIRYTARDGLPIPAYLTLPNGLAAKNLPLVIYPHGGPWVHGESWHWHSDAQFLASRGYAVLQPQFRGSLGYGWKHYAKSFKQWGLAMQDDLTDGVNALVAQGIVDKNRVCIAGASYGGYAVMMGLVKDPDLYRCGVNFVGVTDPTLLYTVTWSDTADSDDAKYGMPYRLGDEVKDAALLQSVSPAAHADRINKPVLMAYGGLDRRVPLIHGEKLRNALQERGVPVEWIVYKEEGHGWNKTVNNVDFWSRVERFLDANIGKK